MPSLILFDFDDTLAMTERHMAAHFYPKMIELLVPYGVHLSMEEIVIKNTELYTKYGSSMHGWMHELNLDMAFTLKMFAEMAPTIREAVMPHMKPDPELHNRLRKLQLQGHTLAILTLGHRDYCLPLIERLGLNEFFPPHMVFDISVMEGRLKREEATFRYLTSHHLTGRYAHKFMFEDSMANLIAAHKAGFTTLLVKDKELPTEVAYAIDFHATTVTEALDHVLTLPK